MVGGVAILPIDIERPKERRERKVHGGGSIIEGAVTVKVGKNRKDGRSKYGDIE